MPGKVTEVAALENCMRPASIHRHETFHSNPLFWFDLPIVIDGWTAAVAISVKICTFQKSAKNAYSPHGYWTFVTHCTYFCDGPVDGFLTY